MSNAITSRTTKLKAAARLLIIGASGFVGAEAAHAASARTEFEIIRANRNRTGQVGTVELDISSSDSVVKTFREVRPDAVLLLAAMSDIDECERSPEKALAINTRGVEYVANECARANARLLFTSTAAVFDGKKHGYTEQDSPTPLSVYGMTKVRAENLVRALTPSAIIVRIALVLGFAARHGTNALLDKILIKWKANEPVDFSGREKRNPIDAPTLADTMITLLSDRALSGIYHIGAEDSISRYELGLRLAERLGVSPALVRAAAPPGPERAPRGEDQLLLTEKIRAACGVQFGSSNQVIERCFL